MSDAPTTEAPAPTAPPPEAQLDHLAHLHRMSRTAGLGSSEYTAVNVAAVAAVVIGAMSAMSLITPIFLILPVAGLVVSIIAIKQISSSGGTQTGMLLAIIGLLACLGFSGFTGFQKIQHDRQATADRDAIDKLIVHFGQLVADKKFEEAMALADPRWQEQVSAKRLETVFGELTAAFGPIKSFVPSGLYVIEEDPETGMRMAVGRMGVEAERTIPERPVKSEIRARNNGDVWKIYSIPDWFPPPAAAGAAGGPGTRTPTGPAGPPVP